MFMELLFLFLLYVKYILFLTILTIIPLLIAIAFFTLAERKIIGAIQRRRGPNVIGYWGFLQAFADGLKLLIKEVFIPYQSIRFLFLLAPCLTFFISLINWSIMPIFYDDVISDLNY